MPISTKSREVVRLERARACAELSKACSRDVERLRATLPLGSFVKLTRWKRPSEQPNSCSDRADAHLLMPAALHLQPAAIAPRARRLQQTVPPL